MFAKILLLTMTTIMTATGTPVYGLSGTCVNYAQDGHLTYDTGAPIEEPFSYITYAGTSADPGDTVYTLCFTGETGEADDIIRRVDIVKKNKHYEICE